MIFADGFLCLCLECAATYSRTEVEGADAADLVGVRQ
jgi:hypothetical protein